MNGSTEPQRRGSRRVTAGVITCPACKGPLKPDTKRCPACNFTGGDSMDLFGDSPPPLLPVLDAVGLFSESDVRKINAAREKMTRRFPQFRWKLCVVGLPPETSLPLFGFWLLNVCPLHDKETAAEREWTALLLIDDATGRAAVIPGYAAEPYVSDDEWKSVLASMAGPWKAGKPAEAVVTFFDNTRLFLDNAWSRYGVRRSNRPSS